MIPFPASCAQLLFISFFYFYKIKLYVNGRQTGVGGSRGSADSGIAHVDIGDRADCLSDISLISVHFFTPFISSNLSSSLVNISAQQTSLLQAPER